MPSSCHWSGSKQGNNSWTGQCLLSSDCPRGVGESHWVLMQPPLCCWRSGNISPLGLRQADGSGPPGRQLSPLCLLLTCLVCPHPLLESPRHLPHSVRPLTQHPCLQSLALILFPPPSSPFILSLPFGHLHSLLSGFWGIWRFSASPDDLWLPGCPRYPRWVCWPGVGSRCIRRGTHSWKLPQTAQVPTQPEPKGALIQWQEWTNFGFIKSGLKCT